MGAGDRIARNHASALDAFFHSILKKRLFFRKKQKGSQGFISCMEVHASAVAEAVGSYVRAWPTCSSLAVDDRALRPRLCALRYENTRRREKKGELAAEISFRRRAHDCKNARMPDGRGGAAIMRAPYSGTVLSRPHIVEMKESGCRASLTPCSPSNSNAKWLAGALLSRRLCTRHAEALCFEHKTQWSYLASALGDGHSARFRASSISVGADCSQGATSAVAIVPAPPSSKACCKGASWRRV